ncbi:MAG: hypothetical protein KA297_31745 [Kofleriaceae bacterium]|nr:hypothetical protein [Kofleriaceae bacterium]
MRAIVALMLLGCGGAPTPAAPPAARPESQTSAPATGFAPQLFTVEQLRAGHAEGRIIELRMEVDGQAPMLERWEFTKVDDMSATIHAITTDPEGKIVADQTGTSTWVELHQHGQFPAATTTFEDDVTVTVPAGTFTTRLYTVKADGETRRFWFAAELPGPPVQFTTEKDGKVVLRALMLRAR